MSTARDYIRVECIESYMPLIKELINKTRKEEGNINYTLYADKENLGAFVLLEYWKDKESMEQHFASEHFTTIVPKIKKLQSKPSIVNVYEEI